MWGIYPLYYAFEFLPYDCMHDEAVAADHRVGEDDGLANPRPGPDDYILADADVGTKLEFEAKF